VLLKLLLSRAKKKSFPETCTCPKLLYQLYLFFRYFIKKKYKLNFKNIFICNDYFEPISECGLDLDKNSPEMKTNILSDLLQLGTNEDLSPYTRLAVEEENELRSESSENFSTSSNNNSTTQLAGFKSTTPKIRPPSLSEISFSDGPSKEPEEGNFRKKSVNRIVTTGPTKFMML
jgi:hypothetical protein